MIAPGRDILLVEDNEDDVFAMKRVLTRAGIVNPLRVIGDGQAAIDYFSSVESRGAASEMPFLVFLDLKLPYADGFQVLSWIRQRGTLSHVVVVVLTSSAEPKDHERAYALGARSYLIKPPSVAMLNELIESLHPYWFGLNGALPIVRAATLPNLDSNNA